MARLQFRLYTWQNPGHSSDSGYCFVLVTSKSPCKRKNRLPRNLLARDAAPEAVVKSGDAMKAFRHIREATLEDSTGLKSCMESAYAFYQERMGGIRLPPMDVDYSCEIENYSTWVVESDKSIVGGLIMDFDNEQALIANIAVDPGFQGQGIGGELMQFAESTARESNYHELHLATHVLLHENIALYLHLGWQETGRDETRVFMRKKI